MPTESKKSISFRIIFRMLAPLVRPFGWLTAGVVALSAAIAAASVAEPYIYGSLVNALTELLQHDFSVADGMRTLVPYLAWWVVIVLVSTFFVAIHTWIVWYIGNILTQDYAKIMFQKMLTLSIRRFQDEHAGAMLTRFSRGSDALWQLETKLFGSIIQGIVTLAAVMLVGIWLDWRLTLAALAVIPATILIGLLNLKLTLRRQEVMNDQWEKTDGLVGDAFSNITTVQSEAGERHILARFAKYYGLAMKQQLKINVQWSVVEAGNSGVSVAGRLLIFFVGIWLVLNQTASLGTLVTFLGFSGVLYATVQNILLHLPEIAGSLNRLDRVARDWQEIPEIQNVPDAKPLRIRGDVTFRRVSFSYTKGTNVLSGINLHIPAGKRLAIVGESGAGKSTLARLMVRFADPTGGAILVDGVDMRKVTLESLRPQVGFVMQENLLFHDTVLRNIRFAKPDATEKEIIEAAKRAQAHEFIRELKRGYETVVGERGVKLSGGQKQRIALARVLLANPPILVLDEATSALDSKTEHALQVALREVMKDRTTIVIAHRLSTVMDADMIVVMDKGKIVDQGTHAELITRGGLYTQYWNIQAGGYV